MSLTIGRTRTTRLDAEHSCPQRPLPPAPLRDTDTYPWGAAPWHHSHGSSTVTGDQTPSTPPLPSLIQGLRVTQNQHSEDDENSRTVMKR